MTQTNTKACCPYCHGTDLYLVGFFLLGPEGVPYSAQVNLKAVAAGDFAMTRELLRCDACGKNSTLENAQRAAKLPVSAAYWEMTDKGIKRPVVCPKCQNTTHFVRDAVKVVETQEIVEVVSPTDVTIHGMSSDAVTREVVATKYWCNEEACDGCVSIRIDNYALSSSA